MIVANSCWASKAFAPTLAIHQQRAEMDERAVNYIPGWDTHTHKFIGRLYMIQLVCLISCCCWASRVVSSCQNGTRTRNHPNLSQSRAPGRGPINKTLSKYIYAYIIRTLLMLIMDLSYIGRIQKVAGQTFRLRTTPPILITNGLLDISGLNH